MAQWKILEVLRQGTLVGPQAGKTTKLKVKFPWGVEEREFAPTIDVEGIRNTLDSIVRDHDLTGDESVPTADDLVGLTG